MTDELSRQVLESEVARLQKETDELRAMLSRPLNVNVNQPVNNAMQQVVSYLPQLTQIATNLAYTASNITAVNANLERIAKALEEKGKP